MPSLNYHHLLYFWTVVEEGSVSAAGQRLHVAQPTVSTQIQRLERSLGQKLFERQGRHLVPTAFGKVVAGYAERIFRLGEELETVVRRSDDDLPVSFTVGAVNVLPKMLTFRILEHVRTSMGRAVQLTVEEAKAEQLLEDLAASKVDVILSDTPVSTKNPIRAFHHPLGETEIGCFGTAELAERYGADFPKSLDRAPFLAPTRNTVLRRELEEWFRSSGIQPSVVAEFEDSALLKVFGRAGDGLFAAPMVVREDVERTYGVQCIGEFDKVTERYYAITLSRHMTHPCLEVLWAARSSIFGAEVTKESAQTA